MKGGQIAAVELLTPAPDLEAIEQAKERFKVRRTEGFDGYEVWDRARFLYRHQIDLKPPIST
jgi:hypothetical protein